MQMNLRILVLAVTLCGAPVGFGAQETTKATAPPSGQPKTAPVKVEDKPLPGPKYLNLRYDEDFSYLDGEPGSHREDFFDPIKDIHLGHDWRLSLGGEFRFQMQAEANTWTSSVATTSPRST